MLLTQSIADLSLLIYIGDDLGLPVEDLDASDLTTIHFVPARGSEVGISLTDLTDAAADAHLDGGIIHRRNGYYRLDVPDSVGASALASGALVFEGTDTRLIGASIQVVAVLPAQLVAGPGVDSALNADKSDLALEATAQQIAEKTDNLPASPASNADLANLDAPVSSRLATVGYTAPNNAAITAAALAAIAVDDKLTSDRAAKLDRDLAHADDADTYKADVAELASDADMQTLLTRTAQGVSVTIGSHMASDGQTLHIVQGEAYLTAINNAIQVQITDDRLSSAVTSDDTIAKLRIRPPLNCHGTRLTLTGQVTDFDDEASVVTLVFEMTKHESAGLTPGENIYEIDLVLQGNEAYVLTPVVGAPLKVARHIA